MNPLSGTTALRQAPFAKTPIMLGFFAEKLKSYRQLHCMECGLPIFEITDRVVYALDTATPVDSYNQSNGVMTFERPCSRHTCKQRYRIEVALP